MMRQVAGAFAEYEKGRLVAKLRSGRMRKRKRPARKLAGGSPTRNRDRSSLRKPSEGAWHQAVMRHAAAGDRRPRRTANQYLRS
jgi:hypothetical protein